MRINDYNLYRCLYMRINDCNTIFMFFLAFKKIDRYKACREAAFTTTLELVVILHRSSL